jgi:hypothetical protein
MNIFRSFYASSSSRLQRPWTHQRRAALSQPSSLRTESGTALVSGAMVARTSAQKLSTSTNGNSEFVSWNSLRPLGKGLFSTQTLRPQAIDASLSLYQLPASPEYLGNAITWLAHEIDGKQLVTSVDFVDKDGALVVTLFDAGRS